MRTKWLSLVLALCLLLSAIPAVTAEDEAFSAPVDGTVEEVADSELWTDEIADAVEAAALEEGAEEAALTEAEEGVPIDEDHFPDETFRAYKKVDSTKYYSAWSKALSKKTK